MNVPHNQAELVVARKAVPYSCVVIACDVPQDQAKLAIAKKKVP
jgi:hypothetical protein